MSCLQKQDKLEMELNPQEESRFFDERDILKTSLKHKHENLSVPDGPTFSCHMDHLLSSPQSGFYRDVNKCGMMVGP